MRSLHINIAIWLPTFSEVSHKRKLEVDTVIGASCRSAPNLVVA